MFGLEAQGKPRKLTTYGKVNRQPSLAYKSFLEDSPEKRKIPAGNGGATHLPSDDERVQRAEPSKIRSKRTVLQKPTEKTGGSNKSSDLESASEKLFRPFVGKQRIEGEGVAVQKKRQIDGLGANHNVSPARDVFDFPDDGNLAASVPLPTRTRARTPSAASRSAFTSASTSRSRKNTPEPSSIQRTPQTARKVSAEVDIFDIPDDDQPLAMKAKARPARKLPDLAVPVRKQQNRPAKDMRDVVQPDTKVKSRATTPQRGRPAKAFAPPVQRKRDVISPKSSTFSGVQKRKMTKGSSAPASLWTMIREPPSPPADSSDNLVSSPGSPDPGSEMEVEPPQTPATPPTGASISPGGVSGSVTPRQKLLWAQLLGDDGSDSPSDLPLSKLQLQSALKSKPSKVAAFERSSSDIPQSATTRRRRLIDNLKAASPVTEDEMDLDESTMLDTSVAEVVPSQNSERQTAKLRSEVSFKKTSTKVTYGQGRTYLEEKNEDRMWEMLTADEGSQSYSAFGSQSQGTGDNDVDMGETSQPRAAHDLRAAGSRRRLHDELSSFIMDIEQTTNSPSIRRSALRDLAEKLLDKEAATCFVESGLDSNFLTAVERDQDHVFLFLEAAVIVLVVAADPTPSVLDHVFYSRTFQSIFQLLDTSVTLEKLVRDRRSNIAKMSQTMVLELRDQIYRADVWSTNKPQALTPRILALLCIELVVRKLREHGSSHTLLEEDRVKQLLNVTLSELLTESMDLSVIELALSALQVNTISAPSMRHTVWPPALIQSFAGILPSLLALLERADGDTPQAVQLALKLAVELTNHDAAACDTIGIPDVVIPLIRHANNRYIQLLDHQAGERYAIAFDFTVLSYGLTINLAEASDKARLAMLGDGGAALEQVIQLFVQAKQRAEDAESLEDTQMNVIYGCVAFTLGNLSRNSRLRQVVVQHLASGNLDAVLDAMQEFAAINRLADKREFEGEEGHEVSRNFTERLQTVLEEVRALND